MYVTEDYRKDEIGVLSLGTSESWTGLVIPPKAEHITYEFRCSQQCTDV